jgi:hypothetical protein
MEVKFLSRGRAAPSTRASNSGTIVTSSRRSLNSHQKAPDARRQSDQRKPTHLGVEERPKGLGFRGTMKKLFGYPTQTMPQSRSQGHDTSKANPESSNEMY